MPEEKPRFEELHSDEILLAGQSGYESLRELILKVDERRGANGIMPVSPQMNWQEIWRSLKHFLIWDQRARVRYILEILSRPEEGDPSVSIKALGDIETELILAQKQIIFRDGDRTKNDLEDSLCMIQIFIKSLQKNKLAEFKYKDNLLMKIKRFFVSIFHEDVLCPAENRLESLYWKHYLKETRSRIFFALTPAGLEKKKELEPQEEARKEAARNKLLDEIVSGGIGGEEAAV